MWHNRIVLMILWAGVHILIFWGGKQDKCGASTTQAAANQCRHILILKFFPVGRKSHLHQLCVGLEVSGAQVGSKKALKHQHRPHSPQDRPGNVHPEPDLAALLRQRRGAVPGGEAHIHGQSQEDGVDPTADHSNQSSPHHNTGWTVEIGGHEGAGHGRIVEGECGDEGQHGHRQAGRNGCLLDIQGSAVQTVRYQPSESSVSPQVHGSVQEEFLFNVRKSLEILGHHFNNRCSC